MEPTDADADHIAADALDRLASRALNDGYLAEASELVRDSLQLRLAAIVTPNLTAMRSLSNSIEIAGRIFLQSDTTTPHILRKAVETYHSIALSLISDDELRLEHGSNLVLMSRHLFEMKRFYESTAACDAAESSLSAHLPRDVVLPEMIEIAALRCLLSIQDDDRTTAQTQLDLRNSLRHDCRRLGINPPRDIIVARTIMPPPELD